jgi:hypothetical protein
MVFSKWYQIERKQVKPVSLTPSGLSKTKSTCRKGNGNCHENMRKPCHFLFLLIELKNGTDLQKEKEKKSYL